MPRLTIDGQVIEVPPGTKVIDAAEALGIVIPRLCYHPALGPAGACRLCAVSFLDGPVKGVLMSCSIEARDGMVVSTQHPEAVSFRKQVIEWLMMNHPHDCPVCDEGGHCLLQEVTVASGHCRRRYPGPKRTFVDQDLGPFVQQEMNRCIHCWRCRRFYQDYAGYRDFGALGIGWRTYFGRATSGVLESPFSGNLVDICPTGALTDKPSRFMARRWDVERAPSLCIHCSLGCNVTVSAHLREIVQVEARYNGDVNGHFICDRGRYGFDYANHPLRPRSPAVRGEETSWSKAIAQAVAGIEEVTRAHGPKAIGVVSSERASLEAMVTLSLLCEETGWEGPAFFQDEETLVKNRLLAQVALSHGIAGLREVEKADLILIVGTDPICEAPLLALAIRQAWRRGAWVGALDPRPIELPLTFEQSGLWDEELKKALLKGAQREEGLEEVLPGWKEALDRSREIVVILGPTVMDISSLRRCGEFVSKLGKKARIFPVFRGPNSLAASALSRESTFRSLARKIREGKIKALLLVEADPFHGTKMRGELEASIRSLELTIVIDYLPSEVVKRAHILIPSATIYEGGGSFINQEGRLQRASPVHRGGIPLRRNLQGNLRPPRTFAKGPPGETAKSSWQVLLELGERIGKGLGIEDKEDIWKVARERFPFLWQVEPGGRISWEGGGVQEEAMEEEEDPSQSSQEMRVLLVTSTFAGEELSQYSSKLDPVRNEARAFFNEEVASQRGLRRGDRIWIRMGDVRVPFSVKTSPKVPSKLLILDPGNEGLWREVREVSKTIGWTEIERA